MSGAKARPPPPGPSCLSFKSSEPSQAFLPQVPSPGTKGCGPRGGLRHGAPVRKDSGLWERPSRQPRMHVHASQAHTRAFLFPCAWPRDSQGPEPAGREVAARLWHQPQPRALGQLRWPPVKASKGCARRAGDQVCLKQRENKRRPLGAGLAGACGGRKRRPQREGCRVQDRVLDRVQAALEVPGVAPTRRHLRPGKARPRHSTAPQVCWKRQGAVAGLAQWVESAD